MSAGTPGGVMARLARAVFGAYGLSLIARGHLDDAAPAQNTGGASGGWDWHITGRHVEYHGPDGQGRVALRALADWAAGVMTPEAGQALLDVYRRYTDATEAAWPLSRFYRPPADPEVYAGADRELRAASDALGAAAEACLAEPELDLDDGLFSIPVGPRPVETIVATGGVL